MIETKKCGIFTWYGYLLPFKENLKIIKSAGFDSICTWWGNEFEALNGDKRSHPETAAHYSLNIENAHLPYNGCNMLWHDNISGEEILEFYILSIKEAAQSGITKLVFHPSECADYEAAGGDQGIFYNRMHKIADIAAKYGIYLAIENVYENDTLDKLLELFCDNPYIGMCFDTGHNNIAAHNDLSLLKKHLPRLFALHIHDNNGTHDQHLLPYEGNIDWSSFISVLHESKYSGSLMLESCCPFDYDLFESTGRTASESGETPYEYLIRALNSCKRIYES